MAKEKYYTVEKFNNPGSIPFFIGGITGDVLCVNEEDAQMIVDALNMMRALRKVKREAGALAGSLETFSAMCRDDAETADDRVRKFQKAVKDGKYSTV